MPISHSSETSPADAPVVIVGGGPVGLSLAGDLGLRGIRTILVEQSDGTIGQPKMDGVNVRTMEFCRRWGISKEVHECGYPQHYPQDMVYLTSFAGYELGREVFVTPSGGVEEHAIAASPEVRARCPQNLFDPILRRFAERVGLADLRYQTRFKSFEETEDGVAVEVEDLVGGKLNVLKATYLVGCDGADSRVRELIDAQMIGANALTFTTNVIFRCEGLQGMHNKALGYRHIFIGPEGTWATCVAINGRDEWRMSIIGSTSPAPMTKEEIRAAIDRALGMALPYEVRSVNHWVRRELVADRFRRGRVFIAGDAAHVMSPTGGFGMNTGIADAVDLSWKIAATVHGWGGDRLLDSYEAERRPVARRAAREASGNLKRMLSPGPNPKLTEATLEGAAVRYEVGRRYAATMLREWYKLGIDLGYVYENSPTCWPLEESGAAVLAKENHGGAADASAKNKELNPSILRQLHKLAVHNADGFKIDVGWTELPAEEVMVHKRQIVPGVRVPHVWLEDGRSTLDVLSDGFTLFVLGSQEISTSAIAAEAKRRRMPLTVVALSDEAVMDAFQYPLVLVRPDGHIAWAGRSWPSQGVEKLLDRVRGATPLRQSAQPASTHAKV